jgi:N-ethylmaleimide reductase
MNIPDLFTPVRLGAIEAPNRIIMTPLNQMRAVPVPLAALRKEFHGPLIVANGFTYATATQALAEDMADAVAFGRLFIANPDLTERFRLDAPLNPLNEETLYGGAQKGYTDYPAMGPQLVER